MSLQFDRIEGYNWCSFNIESISLETLFANVPKPISLYSGRSDSGLIVYTEDGAIVWQLQSTSIFGTTPAQWSSDLTVDFKKSYIIHLPQDVNVTFDNVTQVSKTEPIQINKRFSWIGYHGENSNSIEHAMCLVAKPADLNEIGDPRLILYREGDAAVVWQLENDTIFGKTAAQWSEDINLERGKGYILKAQDEAFGKDFVYSYNDPTTTVTVSGGKYVLDTYKQATVSLLRNKVCAFDQSDASNSTHPLGISKAAESSTYYTEIEGVSSTGSTLSFKPSPYERDTLYYYCQNHPNMGHNIAVYPTVPALTLTNVTVTGNANEYTADINFSNDGLCSKYVTGMQLYFEQIQISNIDQWSDGFSIPDGVSESYMSTVTSGWKVSRSTVGTAEESISLILIEYLTAGNPTFKDTKLFRITFTKVAELNSLSFLYTSAHKTIITDENADEHPIKLGSPYYFDTLDMKSFTDIQTLANDSYVSNNVRSKPTQHSQENNMFVSFSLNMTYESGDIVLAVDDSLLASVGSTDYLLGYAELSETDNVHNICVYKDMTNNSNGIRYKYYESSSGNVYDIRNNMASTFNMLGYGTFGSPVLFHKEESLTNVV